MNTNINKSNTNPSELTKLSNVNNVNYTNSKDQDNTDLRPVNRECRDRDESSSTKNQEIIRSKQDIDLNIDADSDTKGDTKRQQTNENNKGLLYKIGRVFSNTYERAKEIIFPDMGEREECSSNKETKNVGQIDEEKSRSIEKEKQAILSDENRPENLMSEGDKDIIDHSSSQTDKGKLPETEKQIPYSDSSLIEKTDDNIFKCKTQGKVSFDEQPKEELSTPIKHEEIEPMAQGNIDTEKISEKLQALDLNRKEQSFDEKEQAVNNQNFYQDISYALQFGGKPAQEETNINEEKVPNRKEINIGKINVSFLAGKDERNVLVNAIHPKKM
jgi:hypothetical protein